jgi:hypothetical protein
MESIKESYNLTSDEARQMENWLHVAEEPFRFTIVAPGEKSSNGGEYGFWEEWVPIPNLPGLYRVYTETSCDFDNCGCGFERIQVLSEAEYSHLREASDKIEEAGSLY